MSQEKQSERKVGLRDGLRQSSLDLSGEAMAELSSQVVELVTDYFNGVSQRRVFPDTYGGQITELLGATVPAAGEPLEKLIQDCRSILNASRHNGHPRFFGYVASPSTPAGAFADLIASTLNQNVTSWRSAPAATEVERTVVRWLGSLIGYGEQSPGLLTSGGSMANLIALAIAHRAKSKDEPGRKGLWHAAPMTIYASDQIHLSIPKAADLLGFGREQVRLVESDDDLRMNVGHLRDRLDTDLREGLKPFCVVASAGTVNTGAIDPLAKIAGVACEYGLWFHVDGAYGALGALDERKRPLFAGIERADSVSLDPHKWLYTPIDSGCLLFHDQGKARAAFALTDVDYVKIHEPTDAESFAFWDYGVELSRRFRALKIWLTLSYYGVRRIAEAIREDNSLAEYLAERVREAEDFELLAPVELSICCFRYLPPDLLSRLPAATEDECVSSDAELDRLNARLMHAVQRGGRAYLSNATVRGRFGLRACITNFRTTRADIDVTLEVIRDAAREERMKDEG